MWAILLSLASLAMADDATCQACCRAGGSSSCTSELRVVADGSQIQQLGAAFSVTGLWYLACDGSARFAPGDSTTLDHMPRPGEVLSKSTTPLQLHCVRQACVLPEGACLSTPDPMGTVFVERCGGGGAVTSIDLLRPAAAPRFQRPTVAMVDGRPLVVEGTQEAASVAPPLPSAAPKDTAVFEDLPSLPPDQCPANVPSSLPDSLRAESRRLVGEGDRMRAARDNATALGRYKAALTLDACNAYAWLGYGQAALDAGRPDIAVRALRNATRLVPNHAMAWVLLGQAYEGIQQKNAAMDAYQRAYQLQPTLGEAQAGMRRVLGP